MVKLYVGVISSYILYIIYNMDVSFNTIFCGFSAFGRLKTHSFHFWLLRKDPTELLIPRVKEREIDFYFFFIPHSSK